MISPKVISPLRQAVRDYCSRRADSREAALASTLEDAAPRLREHFLRCTANLPQVVSMSLRDEALFLDAARRLADRWAKLGRAEQLRIANHKHGLHGWPTHEPGENFDELTARTAQFIGNFLAPFKSKRLRTTKLSRLADIQPGETTYLGSVVSEAEARTRFHEDAICYLAAAVRAHLGPRGLKPAGPHFESMARAFLDLIDDQWGAVNLAEKVRAAQTSGFQPGDLAVQIMIRKDLLKPTKPART